MPAFRYTARTVDDEPRSGSIDADGPDAARRELEERGLHDVEIEEVGPAAENGGSISEGSLAGRIAEIGNTGLPLSAGLRLLAEETRGRERRALTGLCDRLDAGEPPEQAFAATGGVTPPLAAVVRAGCRMGRIGPVLDQYVDRLRDREDRRVQLRSSLAYPVVLVSCSLLILVALLVFVVPGFATVFDGFGTEMPSLTQTVVGLSRLLLAYPYLWGGLALLAIGGTLLSTIFGIPSFLQPAVAWIPVVGAATSADRTATFCDMLATLVTEGVPLPEALRIAADAAGDAGLSDAARTMAVEAEQGVGPEASRVHDRLPSGLRSAFLWREDGGALGESLFAAGRVYDSRARVNADLVSSLIGPFTVFAVAVTVGLTVTALFLPLVTLLNNLS